MGISHEADPAAWAHEQAQLLRGGHHSAIDTQHVADEIENLGKSERLELTAETAALVAYLLLLGFQPDGPRRQWQALVKLQRRRVMGQLRDAPSLEQVFSDHEWLELVWKLAAAFARPHAADYIPDFWIWSIEQVLDEEFFPD